MKDGFSSHGVRMELLRCKNCSGSDLKPFPGHPNLVKCSFCGTTYLLNSKGDIEKEEKVSKSIGASSARSKIFGISIIAGILFVTMILVILILALRSGEPTIDRPSGAVSSVSTEVASSSSVGKIESSERNLKGEITKIHHFHAYQDSYYYVAIYKNVGQEIIGKPSIQVIFYDENDKPVDTETGYGFKDYLQAGEETGVLVISKKKNQMHRSEILHFPSEPSYIAEKVKLQLSDIKLLPGKYSKYEMIGVVENVDTEAAEYVSINGVLFNENDKPIAMASTYISAKILKPGQKSIFKISFSLIGGTASTYFVETSNRKVK